MGTRRRYRKKEESLVIAVQLKVETDGFVYRKWGGTQRCKKNDWVVNNDGDVYTIDADTFAKTYSEVSPGVYAKTGEVWAEVATRDGVIQTKEGETHYKVNDYLVFNDAHGTDGYAVSVEKFESMYEPVDAEDASSG